MLKILNVQYHPQRVLLMESGIYDLVLNSKLYAAKKFKKWLIKTLLPKIRAENEIELQQYCNALKTKNTNLINEIQQLRAEIFETSKQQKKQHIVALQTQKEQYEQILQNQTQYAQQFKCQMNKVHGDLLGFMNAIALPQTGNFIKMFMLIRLKLISSNEKFNYYMIRAQKVECKRVISRLKRNEFPNATIIKEIEIPESPELSKRLIGKLKKENKFVQFGTNNFKRRFGIRNIQEMDLIEIVNKLNNKRTTGDSGTQY